MNLGFRPHAPNRTPAATTTAATVATESGSVAVVATVSVATVTILSRKSQVSQSRATTILARKATRTQGSRRVPHAAVGVGQGARGERDAGKGGIGNLSRAM